MTEHPPYLRRLIAWSRSMPEAVDLLPEVYGTDSACMAGDLACLIIEYERLYARERKTVYAP